mmetsp:Transcript_35411/g.92021  ORF Transcript_35411/g.92021 Transcript_35411/m.92021 type:complete len:254 (+) Transcript_35411:1202-1963(+)
MNAAWLSAGDDSSEATACIMASFACSDTAGGARPWCGGRLSSMRTTPSSSCQNCEDQVPKLEGSSASRALTPRACEVSPSKTVLAASRLQLATSSSLRSEDASRLRRATSMRDLSSCATSCWFSSASCPARSSVSHLRRSSAFFSVSSPSSALAGAALSTLDSTAFSLPAADRSAKLPPAPSPLLLRPLPRQLLLRHGLDFPGVPGEGMGEVGEAEGWRTEGFKPAPEATAHKPAAVACLRPVGERLAAGGAA